MNNILSKLSKHNFLVIDIFINGISRPKKYDQRM